jgi:predicted RNase H-like nuclease (RuvC/YqgF family)
MDSWDHYLMECADKMARAEAYGEEIELLQAHIRKLEAVIEAKDRQLAKLHRENNGLLAELYKHTAEQWQPVDDDDTI